MAKSLNKSFSVFLLPFLAFVFAFFIGGLVIVFTDPEIMKLIKSPLNFMTAAGSKIGNSYLAVFQGSIYDINLSRKNGVLGGFTHFQKQLLPQHP